jgi:hypothetical protein
MKSIHVLVLSTAVLATALLVPAPMTAAAAKPMAPVLVTGLDLTDSFSTVVGKLPLSDDWVFGSAAVPPRVGKAITNASELAVDFDPLQPWTGSVTINSELERYAKSFTAANFVFGADYLQIKAIKTAGSFNAVLGTTKATGTALNLDGSAIPLDQLGITSTTGLEVGQLVVIAGRYGMQRISALVPNASVSLLPVLNSPGGVVKTNNTWIMFLHAWWAQSTQALANGATSLAFVSLPAGVLAGMTMMVEDSGGWNLISSDAMTVASRTANAAVLQAPGLKLNYAPPAGKGFVFTPSISSGQIWSKKGYGPHIANNSVVAMEFDLQLPQGGSPSAASMKDIYSQTKLLALPATLPWGAWPAAWLYQLYNGDTTKHRDNSEIDFEVWWMNSRGPSVWTGFNHGMPFHRLYKASTLGSWDASAPSAQLLSPNASQLSLSTPINGGRIKAQLVWQRDKVYKYLNNVLVSVDDYQWTSAFPATFGVNLATGALSGYFPSNLMMPWSDAQLPAMEMKVHEIKVWVQ